MGFLDKLRDGLTRTKQQIVSRFEEIVQQADTDEQRSRPIDVDTIEALEELLISADVGLAATERIVTAVRVARASRREPARSGEGGDPADLRRRRAPGAERPPAARHADRRRQRHREDDDDRQAGEPAEGVGQAAARVRGRYVSRGRRRAARDLGEARQRRHRPREGGLRSGGASCSTRFSRARRAVAIRSWSTPPAGCTRAST